MLFVNVLCTGMFRNARPQGDQAMGLVVPFFVLAGSILVLTLASLLGAFTVNTAAVGTLSSSPWFAGILAVALTLGTGVGAGIAFLLWCEPASVGKLVRAIVVPVGIVMGVFGPLALGVMLFIGVWMPKTAASTALASSNTTGMGLRAGVATMCVLSVAGYTLGGCMFWREIRRIVGNRARMLARAAKKRVWRLLEERRPPKELLADELARLAADAPLSSVIVYLPDQPGARPLDDDCRDIVIRRALAIADLDTQLDDCMKSRSYLDRQGAAEFLVYVPEAQFAARRGAWGRALLAGLNATGDGIACRPGWLNETFDSKPDPLGHVRSLLRAADRFKDWSGHAGISQRLQRMADDAGMLNADAPRNDLLKMFAGAGYRPVVVRPAAGR